MFLTILTRTYKRPIMLSKLMESLQSQTCKDFEHVLIKDNVGIGVPKANKELSEADAQGDYVLILDDDVTISDPCFIERLREMAVNQKPDAMILLLERGGKVLPDKWPIEYAHIDTANICVSNTVWYRHRKKWDESWAADWRFIESVTQTETNILEFGQLMIKTQRISKGQPE